MRVVSVLLVIGTCLVSVSASHGHHNGHQVAKLRGGHGKPAHWQHHTASHFKLSTRDDEDDSDHPKAPPRDEAEPTVPTNPDAVEPSVDDGNSVAADPEQSDPVADQPPSDSVTPDADDQPETPVHEQPAKSDDDGEPVASDPEHSDPVAEQPPNKSTTPDDDDLPNTPVDEEPAASDDNGEHVPSDPEHSDPVPEHPPRDGADDQPETPVVDEEPAATDDDDSHHVPSDPEHSDPVDSDTPDEDDQPETPVVTDEEPAASDDDDSDHVPSDPEHSDPVAASDDVPASSGDDDDVSDDLGIDASEEADDVKSQIHQLMDQFDLKGYAHDVLNKLLKKIDANSQQLAAHQPHHRTTTLWMSSMIAFGCGLVVVAVAAAISRFNSRRLRRIFRRGNREERTPFANTV